MNCLDLSGAADTLPHPAVALRRVPFRMEEIPENPQKVMHCPECAKPLDVGGLPPYAKIECPHCAAVIRVWTEMGQYQITGMLGEGGMSQVFRAVDRTLGREVALKILHQSLSRDGALTSMFEREAKLTAAIVHPNVVKVYSVGQDHGYFYIAMELLDAISLEQLIANKGALSEAEVLGIALDVAKGLRAAYGDQLIHRDIKPGNMLVTGDGTTKLVDFGLALQQGGEDISEDLWATPFYVPPEKLDGLPDTFLGDIYSLGATLYHALTGQPPFDANTSSLDDLKVIKKNAIDLRSAAPGLSKATVRLVEKMMAYRPPDRIATYDELIAQIEEVQSRHFGIVPAGRARKKNRRRGLVAAAVVAVLAIVGFVVFQRQDVPILTAATELPIDTGERVITAGDSTITGQFLTAREQFVLGRLSEAEDLLIGLVANNSVPGSTRIWSHFFLGTIRLSKGEMTLARESFQYLVETPADAGAGDQEALAFLKRASQLLLDPLPLTKEEAAFAPNTIESLGLLAAGLKNWQQGEFETGAALLKTFSESQVPADYVWMEPLKSQAERFLADAAILKSLPNPAASSPAAELAAQAETLRKGAEALRTRGAAPKLVKRRIDRIAEIGKQNRPVAATQPSPVADPTLSSQPAPAIQPVGPTREEMADITALRGALATLSGSAPLLFAPAAEGPLKELALASEKGRAMRDELVLACGRADRFLTALAYALNSGTYEGTIRRRAGRPLEAKITAATASRFVIDLGFGPNEVEVEEFAPDWLVEAGLATFPAPTAASAEAWESLMSYAMLSGLGPLVQAKVAALSEVSPDFAKRWTLLEPLR